MKKGVTGRLFIFGLLSFFSFCMLSFLISHAWASPIPSEEPFPLLPGIEDRVEFWKKIFSEYSSWQMVLHDANHPEIIYDVVDYERLFGKREVNSSTQTQEIERIKSTYSQLLKLLAQYDLDPASLSEKEYELYVKFQNLGGKEALLLAADNIRGQLGQRDKFLEGLIISGRYVEEMKAIFRKYELPEELTVLPHIESNFNYRAYSKKEAAGMWQIIPSTGRMFLKIGQTVDERLDPLLATEAAARFLQQNYNSLGNWPLAITAYNHGRQGMTNAAKETGTTNLVEIIESYQGRFFGFASKNFYAEFKAALEIVRNYKDYFGEVELLPPLKYGSHKLSRPMKVGTLLYHLKLSKGELEEYNPALRLAALGTRGHIPAGFEIKVPKEKGQELPSLILRASAWKDTSSEGREAHWYKVRKGDTLGIIAVRHQTSVKTLKNLNRIGHAHHIRIGQLLKLPAKTLQAMGKAFSPNEVEAAVEENDNPRKMSSSRKQAPDIRKRSSKQSFKPRSKKRSAR